MIALSVTALIVAIITVSFFQPTAPRFFAAAIFVGVTATHELIFSGLVGLQYYGSAALFDLAIIILTSGIHPVPKMVLTLHKICMVSIVANLGGWVLWARYYPPLLYDLSFLGIYAWTLITLIGRTKADVGGFAVGDWVSCVRFNRSAWILRLNRNSGKI